MSGHPNKSMSEVLEKMINDLPQGDPHRKQLEHLAIPYFIKDGPWRKQSTPKRVVIDNIVRNEQINIAAICAGHQIIMCESNMMGALGGYYILLPMKGLESQAHENGMTIDRIYRRNEFGQQFQNTINKEWGSKLERFPLRFIARVVRRPSLQVIADKKGLFEELHKAGAFDFWDIEGGPVQWCSDHPLNPRLVILRVFEIDKDVTPFVGFLKQPASPPFLKGSFEAEATPVLTNDEFKRKEKLITCIFNNPKFQLKP